MKSWYRFLWMGLMNCLISARNRKPFSSSIVFSSTSYSCVQRLLCYLMLTTCCRWLNLSSLYSILGSCGCFLLYRSTLQMRTFLQYTSTKKSVELCLVFPGFFHHFDCILYFLMRMQLPVSFMDPSKLGTSRAADFGAPLGTKHHPHPCFLHQSYDHQKLYSELILDMDVMYEGTLTQLDSLPEIELLG